MIEHWNSMKSVVRYLIGTIDYEVLLPSGQEALLEACSGAYWARENHRRRSRSGHLITVASGPVIWSSRLQ